MSYRNRRRVNPLQQRAIDTIEEMKKNGINLNPTDHRKLTKLDQHQMSVVECHSEQSKPNIIVKAGPGTGKTTTLVFTSINLIAKGVKPNEIANLTYTKKGRVQYKSLFNKVMNPIGVYKENDLPCFKTFHSFATSNILDNINNNSAENRDFITEVEIKNEFQKIKKKYNLFLSISDMKKLLLITRYKIKKDTTFDPSKRENRIAILIYKKYKEFLDEQKKKNRYDYTSLLEIFDDELEKYGGLRNSPIKYLIVDEAQDTNLLMFSIIKNMHPKLASVICVGDDWQRIFEYSGLSLDFEQEFRTLKPNNTIVKVLVNKYRCHSSIQAGLSCIKNDKVNQPISESFEYRIFNFSMLGDFYVDYQYDVLHHWVPKFLEKGKTVYVLFRRNAEKTNFEAYSKNKKFDWTKHHNILIEVCHKVKGGECDVEFICNMIEMNIPWYNESYSNPLNNVFHQTIDDHLKQERKVFYMSASRPSELLILLSPTTVHGNKSFTSYRNKGATFPSQYIQRMKQVVAPVFSNENFEDLANKYLTENGIISQL